MTNWEIKMEANILLKQGKSIRQIARELRLSRNTVRRALREQQAQRQVSRKSRASKLDPYKDYLGLPPLKMLLVLDNLKGHKPPSFVGWLVGHGIMPLYTPIAESWLNMAESMQNILKRRVLSEQHPKTAEEMIRWLEEAIESWDRHPTPFIWGGKRAERRKRSKERLKPLKGSGAGVSRQKSFKINHYIHAK